MLDPTRPDDMDRFSVDINIMMRHTEGTALVMMTYLYSFDYIEQGYADLET